MSGSRGKGHKLKHGRCCLNFKKHFVAARIPEDWHRLPGEFAESFTGDIQKPSGHNSSG